jgi:PASTA domain-containing protein
VDTTWPLIARACGALAIVVLGLAVPRPASAQPDQVPAEVSPGSGYDIVKSGLAPDGPCTLWLGGIRVGDCRGPDRGPLRGRVEVPAGHPAGAQSLACRGCRRVESPGPGPSSSSSSPVPETLTMPDLYGLSLSDARAVLESQGWQGTLDHSRAEQGPFCGTAGLPYEGVVEQSPAPGTSIDPAQPVRVGVCADKPRFRHQPGVVEIQLATVVVLAAPVSTAPPPAAQPDPAPASGVSPRQWLLLAVLVALIAAAVIGLLALRRPTRPRPPIDGVTLRPVTGATTITVEPPGGPPDAPRVRLTAHRDPGIRTAQEEHCG